MTRQQGFSLLEILMAFSILAFSLGILLKIFSGGANTAVIAEEYTAAVQIAESLMAGTAETPLKVGQSSGVENEKFDWLVEVNPYQFNPENSDPESTRTVLYKVKVTVSWGNDNVESDARKLELTTLKLVNKINAL
ncbi:MAG: type II secretion system protein [Methylococcaceae bacterium]|nr:type II secretion system protein [Methylococcaceae bacterium]